MAKADVLGGLYRVRRTDAPRLAGPERAAAYARLCQPPPLREGSVVASLKRAALAADPASAKLFRDNLKQHARPAPGYSESAQLVRVAAEGLGRLGVKTRLCPE